MRMEEHSVRSSLETFEHNDIGFGGVGAAITAPRHILSKTVRGDTSHAMGAFTHGNASNFCNHYPGIQPSAKSWLPVPAAISLKQVITRQLTRALYSQEQLHTMPGSGTKSRRRWWPHKCRPSDYEGPLLRLVRVGDVDAKNQCKSNDAYNETTLDGTSGLKGRLGQKGVYPQMRNKDARLGKHCAAFIVVRVWQDLTGAVRVAGPVELSIRSSGKIYVRGKQG